MREGPIGLTAVVALAVLSPAGAGAQQIQGQEATVAAGTTGTIGAPAGPPSVSPFAAASVRTYTYQPVCELRRVQFSDEYGWRVRDVRVCY